MAVTLPDIVAKVRLDTSGLSGAVRGAQGEVGGLGGALSKVGQAAMTAGKVAAVGIGAIGAGLGVLAVKSIGVASDIEEFGSRVNVVFGNSAESVQEFAQTTTAAYGISNRDALKFLGSLGAQQKGLGMTEEAAAKNAVEIVKLAGDWASFANKQPEEVLEAMESAFRGEYDALQAVIPAINAAKVETEAMALSGKKNAKALTDQEKAQAIMNIMMRESTLAIGDAKRTSESWANVTKRLKAIWVDFQGVIGNVKDLLAPFLAVIERIASAIMRNLTPAVNHFKSSLEAADFAGTMRAKFEPMVAIVEAVAEDVGFVATEFADNIAKNIAAGDWAGARAEFRRMLLTMVEGVGDMLDEANIGGQITQHIIYGTRTGDWAHLRTAVGDRLVETLSAAVGALTTHAAKIGALLGLAIGQGLLSPEFTRGISTGLIAGLTGREIEDVTGTAGATVGGWFVKGLVLIGIVPGLTAGWVLSAIGGGLAKLGAAVAGSAIVAASGGSIAAGIINAIVLGFVGLVSTVGGALVTGLTGLVAVVTAPVTLIVAAIAAAIAGVGYLIYRNWDTIKQTTVAAWDAIVGFFRTIPARFQAIVGAIVGAVQVLPSFLYDLAFTKIPYFVGAVINWFFSLGHRMGEATGNAVIAVAGWFAQLPGRVIGFVTNLYNAVTGWFERMRVVIPERVGAAVNATVGWFAQLPGRVAGFVADMYGRVVGWFDRIRAEIPRRIQAGVDAAVGFFQQLPGRITGALNAALQAVMRWGGELWGAMQRAASRAWEGFKAGLGISSPSYIEEAMWKMRDNTLKSIADMVRGFRQLERGVDIRPGGLLAPVAGLAMGSMRGAVAVASAGQQFTFAPTIYAQSGMQTAEIRRMLESEFNRFAREVRRRA